MSNEEVEPSTPTDQETLFSCLEAKLVALSSCFEALAHKFDARSSARKAENVDVFDPAESVISLKNETADLPYKDLFKDCEDCGPKSP